MKKQLISAMLMILSGSLDATRIQKIIHQPQQEGVLELCVLEVYFSEAPNLEISRAAHDAGRQTITLQIPALEMTEAEKAQLHAVTSEGYAVSTSVQNGTAMIAVTYDPTKVSVVCSPLVSISLQHGVVMRFFDQSLLKKISDQSKPILSVACLTIG